MRSDKPVDYVTDKEAGVAQELEDFFEDCSCWGLEPAEPQGGMFGSYHTVAVVPQYAGTIIAVVVVALVSCVCVCVSTIAPVLGPTALRAHVSPSHALVAFILVLFSS
jgi:hypothetical protein